MVAYALGLALLVIIGLVIIGVAYMYFVKDYWIEVDDMQTKEIVEKYKVSSPDKQDLVKDILDDS